MSEWRPIESAPKAQDVLAFWPLRELDDDDEPTGEIVGGEIVVTRFDAGAGWTEPDYFGAYGAHLGDDVDYTDAPTHWMPLPAPPNTALTGRAPG